MLVRNTALTMDESEEPGVALKVLPNSQDTGYALGLGCIGWNGSIGGGEGCKPSGIMLIPST